MCTFRKSPHLCELLTHRSFELWWYYDDCYQLVDLDEQRKLHCVLWQCKTYQLPLVRVLFRVLLYQSFRGIRYKIKYKCPATQLHFQRCAHRSTMALLQGAFGKAWISALSSTKFRWKFCRYSYLAKRLRTQLQGGNREIVSPWECEIRISPSSVRGFCLHDCDRQGCESIARKRYSVTAATCLLASATLKFGWFSPQWNPLLPTQHQKWFFRSHRGCTYVWEIFYSIVFATWELNSLTSI